MALPAHPQSLATGSRPTLMDKFDYVMHGKVRVPMTNGVALAPGSSRPVGWLAGLGQGGAALCACVALSCPPLTGSAALLGVCLRWG